LPRGRLCDDRAVTSGLARFLLFTLVGLWRAVAEAPGDDDFSPHLSFPSWASQGANAIGQEDFR